MAYTAKKIARGSTSVRSTFLRGLTASVALAAAVLTASCAQQGAQSSASQAINAKAVQVAAVSSTIEQKQTAQMRDVSRNALQSQGAPVLRLLKQEDPETYWDLIEKISAVRSLEETRGHYAAAGSRFRRSLAIHAGKISDRDAKAILGDYIRFGETFGARKRMCGRFFAKGPSALTPSETRLVSSTVVKMSERQLKALIAARDSGRAAKRASDEDWIEIGKTWSLLPSTTDKQIKAVNEKLSNDPAYCEGLVSLIRVIADAEGRAAERVRASFMVDLMAP